MPAIVFLNRYWSFASDDFFYSALLDFLIRVAGLVVIGVPFVTVSSVSTCWPDVISKVFFILVFVICAIMMVLDVILSCASGYGGIMETSKRKHVSTILLVLFILSFFELGVLCASIYFARIHLLQFKFPVAVAYITGCGLRIFHVLQYYIWLMVHFRITGLEWNVFLTSVGKPNKDGLVCAADERVHREAHFFMARSMQRRLNQLMMMRLPNRTKNGSQKHLDQGAIDSAAIIFSDMFYDVDLVPTDIVAGLLLLRRQTHEWVGSGHRVPVALIERDSVPCSLFQEASASATAITEQALSAQAEGEHEWLSIRRLQRMAVLSISIYGKLLYMLMHRGSPQSISRLCQYTTCCGSRGSPTAESEGPANVGCCICTSHNCDKAAVLEMSSLSSGDFLDLSFQNTVYVSPYFVAVDSQTATIVISVRGTLSFEDAIVDLICDGVRLTEVEAVVQQETGKRPTFVGHRGMVNTARKLFQRILANGTIQRAKATHPGYSLVVCGHSLGAGVASLLCVLLRPVFPEVKGYAMGAPLGVMNTELADYTRSFLVSVTYGFDLFARLNMATIVDFKYRLVDALTTCTVPKHRILTRGCLLCLGRYFRSCLSPCCPACCCCPTAGTVGTDTLLLNKEAQQRLFNPYSDGPQNGFAVSAERLERAIPGDRVQSSGDVGRPTRILDEGQRSLLRWLSSDYRNDYLLKRLPPSNRGIEMGDSSMTENAMPHPSESHDLRDGVFGGRVLHLVDVKIDEDSASNVFGRTGSGDDCESDSIDAPDSSFLHTSKASRSKARCSSCDKSEEKGTVAVWTTYEQFRTLLVHPHMFNDHVPHNFIAAMDRVYAIANQSADETPAFPIPPDQVIRRLHGVSA